MATDSGGRRGLIAPPGDGFIWELAAHLGFQLAFLDCRTRPAGGHLDTAVVQAARVGLTSIAIVEDPTTERVLGQLESGVGGLCQWVPSDPETVRAFVEACFYMPMGTRGMAAVRPARYGIGAPVPNLIERVGASLSIGIALRPHQFTAAGVDAVVAALPQPVAAGRGLHFIALALEPDGTGDVAAGPDWLNAARRAIAHGLEIHVWGGPVRFQGDVTVAVEALFIEQLLAAGNSVLARQDRYGHD